MASVWITEFSVTGNSQFGPNVVPVPMHDAHVVQQPVLDPATVKLSAAFGADTNIVCISSDVAIHIKFNSTTADAAVTDQRMPADLHYWAGVLPGKKVSVIVAA